MSQNQIEDWLDRGVEAAKEGESARARDLLLAVIEVDEENESAWLWLSEVVNNPEDKRICLQNVLTLDPNNRPAQSGLDRLIGSQQPNENSGGLDPVRVEIEPVSPAAAVLYPERQMREYDWLDSIEIQQTESIGLINRSRYDDVWEKDYPICSYCAGEIALDDWRCPTCHRKLNSSEYLYARPSPDLYLFITFLLGLLVFSSLAMVLNLILRNSLTDMVWNALLIPILLILAAGAFLRQFWAYSGSIVVLLLTLAVMILTFIIGPEPEDVVQSVMADGLVKTLSERPIFYILAPLEQFVFPIQFIAVLLALLYAIFRVGPDFDRRRIHLEARVEKGLSDSSQFYFSGKNYAQLGMWARAVLHFRRAVTLEPARMSYHRSLAESYARLGYYQRSMDVLESAYRSTTSPEWQANLQEMMERVRVQAESEKT